MKLFFLVEQCKLTIRSFLETIHNFYKRNYKNSMIELLNLFYKILIDIEFCQKNKSFFLKSHKSFNEQFGPKKIYMERYILNYETIFLSELVSVRITEGSFKKIKPKYDFQFLHMIASIHSQNIPHVVKTFIDKLYNIFISYFYTLTF